MAREGRPPVVDDAVLHKLEEVFALGGSDAEACLYANISTSTLYNYQKDNPDFLERKNELKQTPILLARQTVVKSLKTDINSAWKMVERKDPDLHPKQQIDHTTKGDKVEFSPAVLALAEHLNEIHRNRDISSNGVETGTVGTQTPD